MNKFYKDFFYVPQHGKGTVREKVMITRIALSVVLILVCMAAMSFTAYAYFSQTLIANMGVIRSATWDIVVTAESDVLLNDGVYTLNNQNGTETREFTVTLTKEETETSATVGYAKIEIKTDVDGFTDVQTYYSQPIGQFLLDGQMTTDLDRQLKITVPVGKLAYVTFTGEWGTCTENEWVIDEGTEAIVPRFGAVVDNSAPTDTVTTTATETTTTPTQETMTTTTTPTAATTTTTTTDMEDSE